MGMGLVQISTQTQEIPVLGGTTLSIFSKSESWLMEDSDRQDAIQKIGSMRKAGKFHSIMDFVFCELFTKYKKSCFTFYEEKGPPLRELLTEEEIALYDDAILRSFLLAYDLCVTERKVSWKKFLEQVLRKVS
jgi:hypothetical protein